MGQAPEHTGARSVNKRETGFIPKVAAATLPGDHLSPSRHTMNRHLKSLFPLCLLWLPACNVTVTDGTSPTDPPERGPRTQPGAAMEIYAPEQYDLHFMVTQGMRDRNLVAHYPLQGKKSQAGAVNPALQQLDFYIRSPQTNDANVPNREVFDHFFAMEVTWK